MNYYIVDTNNIVCSRGVCDPKHRDLMTPPGHLFVFGSAELGQTFHAPTRTLGAIPESELWQRVRDQRAGAFQQLVIPVAELLQPGSMPHLSASAKAALLAGIEAYKQELRDITKQPDPSNITWPTPPA